MNLDGVLGNSQVLVADARCIPTATLFGSVALRRSTVRFASILTVSSAPAVSRLGAALGFVAEQRELTWA